MTEKTDLWEDLQWRGLLAITTNAQELKTMLDTEPVTFYCGFDPTAPSLHLGNLVQILLMRRLQLAGHKPLALVGGGTGLIGDPRPTAERQLNDHVTVNAWVERLRTQIGQFLDFEGENPALLVNNLDWLDGLTALDFLRDVGKFFRVGSMLRKEAVSARLNSDAGISFTEFSYQILQGYDFLALNRLFNCMLQTGGSDQWGNLTSGIELVHKTEGKTVHAIASPLILNTDGTKFGKSEGNAIWLDAEMTSPWSFFQFWLNTADADVINRLKVFTFLDRAEIDTLAVEVAERPFARAAQKRLAAEVTTLVHGATATDQVIAAAGALFGAGDLHDLDASMLHAAVADLAQVNDDGSEPVVKLLVHTKLAPSVTRAREFVKQGAVSVNNQKVTDADAKITEFLHDQVAILKLGKKNMAAVFKN